MASVIRRALLLGGSFQNSFVGIWVVDLNRVEPFHSGSEHGPGGGGTREVPVRSGAVGPGIYCSPRHWMPCHSKRGFKMLVDDVFVKFCLAI